MGFRMNRAHQQNYGENQAAVAWHEQGNAAETGTDAPALEHQRHGITALVFLELEAAWKACGAFEWIALGYLALSTSLILTFAENLSRPLRLVGLQLFVTVAILSLCRIAAKVLERAEGRRKSFSWTFWHFWRHWYPHLFFLFCFEELAYLVHLIIPGWQDAKLIAADYWLTGVHPSVWLEQFATPGRNEFVQFLYITYFVYTLVVGGVLYYRRDWQAYWSVMTYSLAGYVIGYVISILFPIESPWFAMAGWWRGQLEGSKAGLSRRPSISSSTSGACAAQRFLRSMWRERRRRCGARGGTGGGCSG